MRNERLSICKIAIRNAVGTATYKKVLAFKLGCLTCFEMGLPTLDQTLL
jgi:hypothetical protein